MRFAAICWAIAACIYCVTSLQQHYETNRKLERIASELEYLSDR